MDFVRKACDQMVRQRAPAFLHSYHSSSAEQHVDKLLKAHDEEQVRLLQETCILVDHNDQVVGSASKKKCHLLENINKGMLHRAFSVFLFNTQNELLLQQRSDAKITFPGMFTNTCCSHPLDTKLEKDEEDAMGVKRAAQRKLWHELGITPGQLPLNVFHYVTRIKYQAENVPKDDTFGEHEIDYVLFVKKDVSIVKNPNEVKSFKFVSKENLEQILEAADHDQIALTPWFRLIADKFLFDWWSNVDSIKNIQDHISIHTFS